MKTKPSDFCEYPWSSVCENAESEIVAKNIMVILKKTGDEFRPLSWDEYKEERLKDGSFSENEKHYFNKVIAYCENPETAKKFSKTWAEEK